jgi:hypothetical protein
VSTFVKTRALASTLTLGGASARRLHGLKAAWGATYTHICQYLQGSILAMQGKIHFAFTLSEES